MTKTKRKFGIIFAIIFLWQIQCALADCGEWQWDCDDGSCISVEKRCDGPVDCSDGSDEIAENCIHFAPDCPSYSFTCSYGACVAGVVRCDNTTECADRSDEFACKNEDPQHHRGTCGPDQMQCLTSKECISRDDMCDGIKNCKDGSDEIIEVCAGYDCHIGFKCGYGGCVAGNAKCNNVTDCVDGSDEAWELCNTPRKRSSLTSGSSTSAPSSKDSSQCRIPMELNGVTVRRHITGNKTIGPGDVVDEFEIVHLECKTNNRMQSLGSLLCLDGQFVDEFPKCRVVCDPQLVTGLSTIYNVFTPSGHFVEPSLLRYGIPVGSIVEINCASGFKRDTRWQTEILSNRQNLTCLPNGTFDKVREPCVQDCGHPLVNLFPLTKGGIQTDPNKVPWHVSIYQYVNKQWTFICGGSIITPRIVLSAAHCFWDNRSRRLISHTQYKFVAGKYRREFSAPQLGEIQIKDAQQITVSEKFEGLRTRNFADIAVIKLESPFIYGENVSSICIKPASGTISDVVPSNISGVVTGYNEIHNNLEQVTMRSEGYHECIGHDLIGQTLSEDKFCLYNGHNDGICRGDSGGGFVQQVRIPFPKEEDIFFLLGIISFTPGTENECAREGYVAVTNVKYMRPDLYATFKKETDEDRRLF
ncbi:modular serine protease-like [Musca domestica]|uniref:Modular serine protease-like n=1 Tax=Musca domestica TaxID=7370 RepID=A0ABM3V9Q8_MUSDO|nr:modular serine protease-like [Musca domestica]